ncbi:serine/threonine-protein kinase [Actinoallomurus sp. NBC_01490]|uniref:protein kinase domain-containing protein n=1 Tax=Actinoallomurus sp. NBC_01490 TaxID=2903557 RepID=UPI002E34085D|nr:protein kinase [Actinoallomurus sp. NBC_01490]
MEPLAPGDPASAGPYELVGRLGAGGMGRVYLGRDTAGRQVAVKVVRAELAEERDFRRRFAREVKAARAVDGRYTAAVLGADPDAPTPWLATAYIPGPSLTDHVADHGPMGEGELRRLATGLTHALAAIHAAGLIHRDLKPSNILLAADGPRVIDFGIARAAEASALTRTGATIGSPGYMSPEQIDGRPVQPSSDVFSLGAVLAYAATGRSPFGAGATPALLYRVVHNSPDLAGVPAALLPLITACLDKRPEARPTIPQILATVVPPATVAPTVAEHTGTRVATRTLPAAAPVLSRRRVLAAGGVAAVAVTAAVAAPALLSEVRNRTGMKRGGPRPVNTRQPRVAWKMVTETDTGGVAASVDVDTVFVVRREGDYVLYGLDPTTGAQRWTWTSPTKINGIVEDQGMIFVSAGSRIHAMDGRTGNRAWSARLSTSVFGASSEGVVGWDADADTPTLAFLNRKDGDRRWTYRAGAGADTTGISVSGMVVAFNDHAVAGAVQHLHTVDVTNGHKRWLFTAATALGSPLALGQQVFVGESGSFHSLDASIGTVGWTAPFGQNTAPPVTDLLSVYVIDRSGGTLHALDAVTGVERWKFEGRELRGVWGPVNDTVYLAGSDVVYALAAQTGHPVWSHHATGPQQVVAAKAATVGVVCFTGGIRTLYGLQP